MDHQVYTNSASQCRLLFRCAMTPAPIDPEALGYMDVCMFFLPMPGMLHHALSGVTAQSKASHNSSLFDRNFDAITIVLKAPKKRDKIISRAKEARITSTRKTTYMYIKTDIYQLPT
jgi:hypothetical protein